MRHVVIDSCPVATKFTLAEFDLTTKLSFGAIDIPQVTANESEGAIGSS